VVDAQAPPVIDEVQRPVLVVGGGGDEAGVDGAHRGAADDVEGHAAAEGAGHVLEDVADHPDLIGTARRATGQHQRDAKTAVSHALRSYHAPCFAATT
jgi:hypothetical protein